MGKRTGKGPETRAAVNSTDNGAGIGVGDWAASRPGGPANQVGRVRAAYWVGEPGTARERLLDIVLYDWKTGDKTGRESPAAGGPRHFEPACPAKHWLRIYPPTFPLDRLLNGEFVVREDRG